MAQRRATKHVDSGSGWAEAKPRLIDTRLARPRAILAAVDATHHSANHDGPPWSTEDSLDELVRLAERAVTSKWCGG